MFDLFDLLTVIGLVDTEQREIEEVGYNYEIVE